MFAGERQHGKVEEGEGEGDVLEDVQVGEGAFAFRQRRKVEDEQVHAAAEADEDLLAGFAEQSPKVDIDQAQQGEAETENQRGEGDEQAVEQSVENEAVGADGKGNVGRTLRIFFAKGGEEQRAGLRHGGEKNGRRKIPVVIVAKYMKTLLYVGVAKRSECKQQ